jgi:metal-responsive CopG/Arc/MetJ family transcriptional regulator
LGGGFKNIVISGDRYKAMKRIIVSVSDELYEAIEYERESRNFKPVSETVRTILAEFFRDKID